MRDLARFDRHVATANGPLVVLFEHQGSNQSDNGVVVGKDADDIGATFNLSVQSLQWVGAVEWLSGLSATPCGQGRRLPRHP